MVDFSDLDQKDFGSSFVSQPPKTEVKTFPCQSCGGSGKYRGIRVHQQDDTCFACAGRGYFKKSPAERYADKQKRIANQGKRIAAKCNRIADVKEVLEGSNPGLFEFMAKNRDWNNFFAQMVDQINNGKAMSENQLAAVVRMEAKIVQKREEKQAARDAQKKDVDLSPIAKMFENAMASGLKRLAYRAEGLVLSPAKATGANPGAIYVKRESGEYEGKVINNKFSPVYGCKETTVPALEKIAIDPAEAARLYGKETGACSCCGRELTDPDSIAAGIGPICATKWGF